MVERARGPVVLVVEDDRSLQGILAQFLSLQGFGVIRAATADAAHEIVRTRPFAAAVVDLRLLEGSGRDVIVEIPQPIPVVIFSGVPEESGELERLRPHTRLIPKPNSLLLVVETLKEMLAASSPFVCD